MQLTRTEVVFFYIALTVIYLINLQTNFYGWDISWGVFEARRLLEGGTFGKEFFETSPPMFLYLYSVPILISKLFAIKHIIPVFQTFINTLSACSLLLCYFFIKQLFTKKNNIIGTSILLTIASIFVLLPLPFDFGQREHLLVILTLPYYFLVTFRLENKKVPRSIIILTGMLAAMGFSIKPFFVIPFAFVELYCMIYKRSFFAWARLETLIIIGFLLLYTISIFIVYPSYFYMLQFSMDLYYQSIGYLWKEMVFEPSVFFCYLALMVYLIQYKVTEYKILSTVLAITVATLLISHFMQRTVWYYHLLPAYSFAVLLATLLMVEVLTQPNMPTRNYLLFSGLSLLIITYYHFKFSFVSIFLVFSPGWFFAFFGVLFLLSFYIKQENFYKALINTSLILAIAFWITYLFQHTTVITYRFSLTIVFLFVLYSLFIKKENKFHTMFTTIAAMMVLFYPFYNCVFRHWTSIDYRGEVTYLSNFINKYAKDQSVQFFTTTMCFEFPAIDYAEALPASRFAFFVWMPGLIKLGLLPVDETKHSRLVDDRNYLLNSVAQDLDIRKPALVFVDVKADKAHMRGVKFEYLDEFLTNKNFQQAWQSYQYFTTIDRTPYYKYAVYQRKNRV